MNDTSPVLSVRDLVVKFATEEGEVTAVDGVSFDVPRHSTVAVVGESGCGKTVTAHAIMRLLAVPPARIAGGRVELEQRDLLSLPERKMRRVRGERIAIIFQDPLSALNPVYTIGSQLAEAYRLHRRGSRRAAKQRALELLERVGFPEPEARYGHYPHELSGGMRQRVMIAMALACDPVLIIADEPTTALDMLAAAQVGALLRDLEGSGNMSLLLISHDLATVGEIADQVVVLYAGQVVERGAVQDIMVRPSHPYTQGLLRSVPPLRKQRRRRRPTPTRLPTIDGTVPSLHDTVAGCRFADRCPEVHDRCRREVPPLFDSGTGASRCFLAEGDAPGLAHVGETPSEAPGDQERT